MHATLPQVALLQGVLPQLPLLSPLPVPWVLRNLRAILVSRTFPLPYLYFFRRFLRQISPNARIAKMTPDIGPTTAPAINERFGEGGTRRCLLVSETTDAVVDGGDAKIDPLAPM